MSCYVISYRYRRHIDLYCFRGDVLLLPETKRRRRTITIKRARKREKERKKEEACASLRRKGGEKGCVNNAEVYLRVLD